jgi:hypothetical protein
MKKQNRTRSRRTTRPHPWLAEALELRHMCSGVFLTLPAFQPSAVLTQVDAGAGNLALDCQGGIWYTAGNTLEATSASGTIRFVVPAASNDARRDIVSNVVFTQDQSAWFVVSESGGTRLERMTATGTFQDVTAVTSATMGHLTAAQDGVWFIASNSSVGHVDATGGTVRFSVAGAKLQALTTGPDGNVWFAGAASGGQGVVGKVMPSGAVEKFTVPAPVSSIAASADGSLYAGGRNEIWRVSAAGAISEALRGDFAAQSLTSAPDGTLWFLDAAHPDRAITRVSGTFLQQYGSGIQDGATVNSLIAAGGNIWFTACGPAAAWLGKFPSFNSITVICNAGSNLPTNGTIALTQGWATAAILSGSAGVLLPAGSTGFDFSSDHSTVNSAGTSSEGDVHPSSFGVVMGDTATPTAAALRTQHRVEGAPGSAADEPQERVAQANIDAGAHVASPARKQDPGTFEGEFRLRSAPGNPLPPRKASPIYYSSTVQPTTEPLWAERRRGDAPSVFIAAGHAAQLPPAAASAPQHDHQKIPIYVHKAMAARNSPAPERALPSTANAEDWWRLANYAAAASGLQDRALTKRRIGG